MSTVVSFMSGKMIADYFDKSERDNQLTAAVAAYQMEVETAALVSVYACEYLPERFYHLDLQQRNP